MPPIGLPKLNMGEKPPKPPKGAAADSLKAQPRATGVGTRSVGSTGALNQGATMQLFGYHKITAERSNHLVTNVKAGNSLGISNIRHELLGLRRGAGIGLPIPQPKAAQPNNAYMDSYTKMMELQMLKQTIGDTTAAGLALAKALGADGKGGTEKPKGKEDPDTNPVEQPKAQTGTGKVSKTATGLVDGMKNANDVDTLSSAIDSSQKELDAIDSDIKSLETEESELKQQETDLNTQIGTLTEDIGKLDTAIKNLDGEISQLRTSLTTD